MKKILLSFLLGITLYSKAEIFDVTTFGAQPNSFTDATISVQKAIDMAKGQEHTVINFPKGRYDFWPDQATETNYYITNSSSEVEFPTKKQRVGLFFRNLKNITVNGNGSRFVFHGKMISWVLDHTENIKLSNFIVDYERPGMSEMTLTKITPTIVEARIHPDSKFAIIEEKLEWYGEKWKTYNNFSALVKPAKDMVIYNSWSPFAKSTAEQTGALQVRFTGNFSRFKADTGDVLTTRDPYRDYVGVFQNRSKNIVLRNIQMNSMHGLGIVSQFCENLNYDSVVVEPAKNGGRMIASSADGMHFSGCKGQITINHARFSGLHDDPINVHGTHLIVTEIVSPITLKLKFMHHQSYGFEAFIKGDTVAYLNSKSLQIFADGVIESAKLIAEREMLVELEKPFAEKLEVGDALENITWTPALTIKNSHFQRTISRGTLVTTRRKVIIENNVYYRTGMHAILIENDAQGWYESGPVTDLTIRNNQFIECGFNSSPSNYVIKINPENSTYVPDCFVHKNIRIENNTFKVYDFPILSAKSTSGLSFVKNKVEKSHFLPAGTKRPSFKLTGCTKVTITANQFYKGAHADVETSEMTSKDIKTDLTVTNK